MTFLTPKTIPRARDYARPWDPTIEQRCIDCGTANRKLFHWDKGSEMICNGCAANRLGA